MTPRQREVLTRIDQLSGGRHWIPRWQLRDRRTVDQLVGIGLLEVRIAHGPKSTTPVVMVRPA